MKRILSISLALLMIAALVTTLSFSAAAKSGSFIYDEKNSLSVSEFNRLEETAQDLFNSSDIAVCYLLSDDLGGKTAQARAEEIATSSAPGSSALVLVDSYDDSELLIDVYAFGLATVYLSQKEDLISAYNSEETYVGGATKYMAAAQKILLGESAGASSSGYQNVNDLGAADGQLVVDGADLLSESQEASLNTTAGQIGEKHNCSIVIVTTPSLEGKTATQFADDYFDYHHYKENGILFLIAYDNTQNLRTWAISTTGDCINRFNESKQEHVIERIKDDLSSLNWNKAFEKYLTEVDLSLTPHVAWYWIPLSLLIGFVIAMIIMAAIKKQLTSVKMQSGAKDYVRPGSMVVTASRDTFLYHTVTRTAKPKDTSSGSGTHIGSSGTSHGGSSGSF